MDKLGLWHRMPVFMGLAYLGIRRHLHQRYNLLHVGSMYGQKYDHQQFCYRTADGSCNHPFDSLVGSQGTFFGRNMPPSSSPYGVIFELLCLISCSIMILSIRFGFFGCLVDFETVG